MLHHQGRLVKTLRREGRQLTLLASQGRGIYPPKKLELASTPNRMVLDATGYWLEFGWRSTELLTGSAEAGWQDSRGLVSIRAQTSEDLLSWTVGNVVDAAGSPEAVGDGTYIYWVRCKTPQYWQTTLRDFRVSSAKHGKSITGIHLYGTDIALAYPYAMPSEKARLQADLRTAGYPGTLVTSASAAYSLSITNHTVGGAIRLNPTLSGSNVTEVRTNDGTLITGPSYPYSMPGQKAALQTALRSAGYSGAVVVLFADPWDILIPDRNVSGSTLVFNITIDPGDPFKVWDFFGNYQGEAPANAINGAHENTRTPAGAPLQELGRQFGRFAYARL
jgi:hypothetical protein